EYIRNVQDIERRVVPERHGTRTFAERYRIVQELEANPLVAASDPGKEHIGNTAVRFHCVRERVVHGLIPAELQATLPSALDQQVRRRDHEEQVNGLAESRQ